MDKRRKAVLGPSYSSLEISEELASVVAKKAFAFGVQIVDEMLNAEDRHGQAGLIQNPYLATQDSTPPSEKKQKVIERYGDCTQQKRPAIKKSESEQRVSAIPITALHNVVNDTVKGVKYNASGLPVMMNSDTGITKALEFQRKGDDIDRSETINVELISDAENSSVEIIPWTYGIDISCGDPARKKAFEFTDPNLSFEVVGPNFGYKIGQRIGMAVYRNYEFDFISTGENDIYANNGWDRSLSKDDIFQLFGPDHSVSIHTGVITQLSSDGKTFGHDINTYKGCSGAIVFLLDKNQDGLIADDDAGKAIAIHVGCGPRSTKMNIAFTVRHLLVAEASGSPALNLGN